MTQAVPAELGFISILSHCSHIPEALQLLHPETVQVLHIVPSKLGLWLASVQVRQTPGVAGLQKAHPAVVH